MVMNDMLLKLPIGIQTFEDIRTGNYLNVDKTAFIWKIANTGKPYFLNRPRRFGKSLLLSTFEAYFGGRKDLFEGLAIEQMETEWKKHPVLHLDLNAEKYDSSERLYDILSRQLSQWELQYGKGIDENTLSGRFSGIIRRASEQTGCSVVVLVDEYDKPLLQALGNDELLEDYRKTLKAFYGVLKSAFVNKIRRNMTKDTDIQADGNLTDNFRGYAALLRRIKQRVLIAQQRAIYAANEEMLRMYWALVKCYSKAKTLTDGVRKPCNGWLWI